MRNFTLTILLTLCLGGLVESARADDPALRARADAFRKALGEDTRIGAMYVAIAAGRLLHSPTTAEEVPEFRQTAERIHGMCQGDFADVVAAPRPNNPRDGEDFWSLCEAVARRDELLAKMVERYVRRDAEKIAKNQAELADKLPRNKGWIDSTGVGFALVWGGARGHPPRIARLRGLCTAAGLPAELVETAIAEAAGDYWAKVEALGKTLTPTVAVAHDKGLEARAKATLNDVAPGFGVVAAGLHDSDWSLTLDGRRQQPISRHRSGFLVLSRAGEPLCREVVFVAGEHYQGKKWVSKGEDVVFERYRFVACP